MLSGGDCAVKLLDYLTLVRTELGRVHAAPDRERGYLIPALAPELIVAMTERRPSS